VLSVSAEISQSVGCVNKRIYPGSMFRAYTIQWYRWSNY